MAARWSPRLVLVLILVGTVLAVNAEEGVQPGETELDEIRSRLETLTAEQAAAEAERERQSTELRAVEEEIGAIALRVHELKAEREQRQESLAQLHRERDLSVSAIEAQRRHLAGEVRLSYLMGRQERLKMLLNQEDPDRLSRVLAYYQYLQRRRVARISEVEVVIQRLDATQRQISLENERLDGVLQAQEIARQRLEVRQVEREDILAILSEDIRERGGEVAQLQRDQERLAKLLDRLKREQARAEAQREIEAEARIQQRSFSGLRGKLAWPAEGSIQAAYGAPKGSGLKWDGALIAAPAGQNVSVIHGGRVVFADWLKGYGLLMIVDHGDGYMSLYGYNQGLFRSAGDWVTAGEVIGIVGNSGGRSEPGLYFGIRHQGKPVDPARWCQRTSGGRIGGLVNEQGRLQDAS